MITLVLLLLYIPLINTYVDKEIFREAINGFSMKPNSYLLTKDQKNIVFFLARANSIDLSVFSSESNTVSKVEGCTEITAPSTILSVCLNRQLCRSLPLFKQNLLHIPNRIWEI